MGRYKGVVEVDLIQHGTGKLGDALALQLSEVITKQYPPGRSFLLLGCPVGIANVHVRVESQSGDEPVAKKTSPQPAVVNPLWKFVHNVLAHPLMEFLPERWGTAFHDWTAERMGS